MSKTIRSTKRRDETTRIVAEIHGVSMRYVNMVRNGERQNEEITATLVDYEQGKSNLIKHLEALVPLKPQPEKYGRKEN